MAWRRRHCGLINVTRKYDVMTKRKESMAAGGGRRKRADVPLVMASSKEEGDITPYASALYMAAKANCGARGQRKLSISNIIAAWRHQYVWQQQHKRACNV